MVELAVELLVELETYIGGVVGEGEGVLDVVAAHKLEDAPLTEGALDVVNLTVALDTGGTSVVEATAVRLDDGSVRVVVEMLDAVKMLDVNKMLDLVEILDVVKTLDVVTTLDVRRMLDVVMTLDVGCMLVVEGVMGVETLDVLDVVNVAHFFRKAQPKKTLLVSVHSKSRPAS